MRALPLGTRRVHPEVVSTGSGAATDRAGTPILCADRTASHDPETYFRDIEAHRAHEPLFGPLVRNITPCAYWPTAPAEQPTVVHNDAPALMVGATGDPVTPYADGPCVRSAGQWRR